MDFSKHTDGTTSVKVHHAPGGKSNFSLAWDTGDDKKPVTQKPQQKPVEPLNPQNQPQQPPAAGKTSVKVHNPPGGKSNIIFG